MSEEEEQVPLVAVTTVYEDRPPAQVRVLENGALQRRVGDDPWLTVTTYDGAELAQLRDAIADADDPPLESTYGKDSDSPHPRTSTWRLQRPGGVKTVTIRSDSSGKVPALDALYDRIFSIPRQPDRTTRWRLRNGGQVIEHEIVGEMPRGGPFEAIFKLISERPDAFAPEPGPPAAAGPDEPLVAVDWFVDGEQTDRLTVGRDGEVTLVERGEPQRLRPLEPERLERLRELVSAADWATMPDPVADLRSREP